uniref:peptide-methionine (S)-S-oxide reductase n=1 Tax=Esox lucius TaxID=8010 RepID=A0AAY5KM56_ESOLU
ERQNETGREKGVRVKENPQPHLYAISPSCSVVPSPCDWRTLLAPEALGRLPQSFLTPRFRYSSLTRRSADLESADPNHNHKCKGISDPEPVDGVDLPAYSSKPPHLPRLSLGRTGHTEVVRVLWDPEKTSFAKLLKVFWESHNPTQGMRQGNDVGTTYRSAVYTYEQEHLEQALASKHNYQKVLTEGSFGEITTEIAEAKEFFYAEDYHQQYLAKNPRGYCGLSGTGVSCPVGLQK